MTLDDAAAAISRISYKPGWTFAVARTATGAHLVISPPDGVANWAPLPLMSARTMTVRRLVVWVFDWLRGMEERRAEAAFRYDGQALGEVDGP